MPRPSKTKERQQQIVQGLMRALGKRGYAGAPISAIAREAGLAPGLVHYYFKDKRDVYDAMIADVLGGLHGALEEALARVLGAEPGALKVNAARG